MELMEAVEPLSLCNELNAGDVEGFELSVKSKAQCVTGIQP
jgi:hypothetical protein